MLKVRSDTKSVYVCVCVWGGGGVQSASDPIRKVGGGGEVCSPHQIRYEKGGGGGQSTSGPIQKSGGGGGGSPLQVQYKKCVGGGGGGGAVHFRSDAFLWHTENTSSLIINGYNFDRGGCSSTRSTPPGYATEYL